MQQFKTILKAGDSIYLSGIAGQAIIGAVFLVVYLALGGFEFKADREDFYQRMAKKWNPELTLAAKGHGEGLDDFTSALRANGMKVTARFVPCGSNVKALPVVDRTCLVIERVPGAFELTAQWLVVLVIGSFLLMGVLWLRIRNCLRRRFYTPIFESLESEAHAAAIGKVTRQLAHDIRSPLNTLTSLLCDSAPVDQDGKKILLNAAARLEQISRDLLSEDPSEALVKKTKTLANLVSVVGDLVAEKQSEFKLRQYLCTLTFETALTHALADIDEADLRRILSNLINNSLEASVDRVGTITVLLRATAEGHEIVVKDKGKGIPAVLKEKLGLEGFSTKGGNGLGLSHAKRTMESWGGSLSIESVEQQGTSVCLHFGKTPQARSIVLLDDSSLTHQTWQYLARRHGLAMTSFTSTEAFLRAVETLPLDGAIFVDQELGNDVLGVDIAAGLVARKFENVYLCTARDAHEIELPVGVKGLIDKQFPTELLLTP